MFHYCVLIVLLESLNINIRKFNIDIITIIDIIRILKYNSSCTWPHARCSVVLEVCEFASKHMNCSQPQALC